MKQVKIALIREDKVPVDRRVPVTPEQAVNIQERFSHVKVVCQSSNLRCFDDQAYREVGIEVREDVSDCDIFMGVKEVPVDLLISGKTYLFFSHTIKKQPYNRKLLQAILEKNIRLIDYECLTDQTGARIVAFGRFAGIVGAYNALYTYGKKFNLYNLRRARDCYDLQDLTSEYRKVHLPPVKIALTGGGRVARGAMEVLNGLGIRQVRPSDYLQNSYAEPVYTQLEVTDYNRKRDNTPFEKEDFYEYPELFTPGFLPYASVSDILIAGAYWDNRSPVLFERQDMISKDFAIKVIADITCDIEGSIPSTKKSSTIASPVYDYDPETDNVIEQPFRNQQYVSVMAVDNLPSELPRDASRAFGDQLVEKVLPAMLEEDREGIIRRATIAENGHLTDLYMYLQGYVSKQSKEV